MAIAALAASLSPAPTSYPAELDDYVPPEQVLDDPCPRLDDAREQAACWITAAYILFGGPLDEADVALAVAGHESGFRPLACNGDGGKSGPKGSCRRTGASGLFQQMPKYWNGRADATLRRLGLESVDVRLDIFDGWHNTLVSINLAGGSSWRTHWAACSDSVYKQGGTVRCGKSGGWLR